MSIRTSVLGWLSSRFPVDSQGLLRGLEEPVPGHLKRWWWCLGGMPAYLFLVQVITGIMLTFYYVPEPDQAYESVWNITYQIPLGWWIRSLHKWSSNLMIISNKPGRRSSRETAPRPWTVIRRRCSYSRMTMSTILIKRRQSPK